jgi:hypothetical protein
MHKRRLFFLFPLVLALSGFFAIQSGAVGLSGIFRFLSASILTVVLVGVTCLTLFLIWAFVAGKQKKTARAVDGPQLVQQFPDGDWGPSALAFHDRANCVVSTILADDEAVLKEFAIVPPDPHKVRPTSIHRFDKDLGCHFKTDIEGEGDYCLRYSQVRQEVLKQDKALYVALFTAWTTYHMEKGTMKAFNDQDGIMYCWKIGPDDVIGVRLETAGDSLVFSATRAWIIRQIRDQFT